MTLSIEQKFKRSIKAGTGEALLLLKNNSDVNLDPYIVEACTNNLAYDPQCEGTRAEYLYEILTLAKNRVAIENEIIKQLIEADSDYWNTQLLFEVGEIIDRNGNENAKAAIYHRYSKNINVDSEFVETEVLVNLDGIKGLEFCAEIQGKRVKADPDYWTDDWLLEVCGDLHPEINPTEILHAKAVENEFIRAYLDNIAETHNIRSKNKSKNNWTYQTVSNLIDKGKNLPIIVGKWLTEEELLKLANDLLDEIEEKKIESYLRIFSYSKVKFPLKSINIIPFTKSTNAIIRHFALRILSRIEDEEIRNIIETNYHDLKYLNNNFELFTSNFEKKDIDVFLKIIEMQKDEDSIHWFEGIVIEIFEKNKVERPSKILNKLYKLGNCSICRKYIVNILISQNDLSEKILEELKYDCEPDIREIVFNNI
ncbi:hypothetical protein DENIS_1479 [Desulfonema ishimotonii]|uniref:Uncharacterized protein n=1 Tax=Desulfonema ishimotonii TaxID=45657 RepID=A0A401FU68_9BACT|nr:hypothetical protein [Desulfonema ishimotonii]GBC60522.1 hypothetical protein DENIS_1479 [Desulfonema ishimotonii]